MSIEVSPTPGEHRITLRPSHRRELSLFARMQAQAHASSFLTPKSLTQHQAQFDDPAITYLSIVLDEQPDAAAGYFVLVDEDESIEFRRIVIDESHRGIGQAAIALMERWCVAQYGQRRIWLDVYDDNEIGKHIYQKLGYRQFSSVREDARLLLLFEKRLSDA